MPEISLSYLAKNPVDRMPQNIRKSGQFHFLHPNGGWLEPDMDGMEFHCRCGFVTRDSEQLLAHGCAVTEGNAN